MTTLPNIDIVRDVLSTPRKVAILTHRNPDGDAIGASLALQGYLESAGHAVRVIFPSDWPGVYGFLKGIHDILIFDRDREGALHVIKDAEVICLLDLNAIDRIDDMGPAVKQSQAFTMLIDHHLDPEQDIAQWMLSDSGASSTAELMYVFLEMLNETERISRDIAEALFTGIITDTGSFKFSTNPRVFRICAELKEKGVDDYRLQNLIYNSLTEKQLRLIGHCLANRMELI